MLGIIPAIQSKIKTKNSQQTYPEFFEGRPEYTHQTYKGGTMVGAKWKIFQKFVPPDALKMHLLTLSVRFLCKTFSSLFKFTLPNTLLRG